MSLPPDDQIPPAKPKLTAEERRRREADRLASVYLRMAISRELDERHTDLLALASTLGLPAVEVNKLLTRHQWREGDLLLLEVAAARLGLQVLIQNRSRR
jgi:hypothetical protein